MLNQVIELKMAEAGNPVIKTPIKWQIALAIGIPAAIGGGYWYLKSKREKQAKLGEKSYSSRHDISRDESIDVKEKKEAPEKSPLEKATLLKEEGNKWFKSSNFEEAIESYEKAIEICPETETISLAIFYQNKAAAYEQLKKWEDVKEACEKALSLNPKYVKALLRRSKACEQTNDLSQALEDVIAACYLENFQSPSKLVSADRILKELSHQHAKEALAKRIPIMPSFSFIKIYFSSFSNDPINSFLLETDLDTSRGFLKAVDCFKKKEYDSIIPACTEEINLAEAEAVYKNEALILRATFNHLMGENTSALSDLDIVIHNNEASTNLRTNALLKRATIYMQLEDTQRCFNDFNSAVTIDPHNPDIYHQRGQVNLRIEKIKEAADDFKVAFSLNPNNPVVLVRKCFAELHLELLANNVEKLDKFLEQFEDIKKRYPEQIECYTFYARVLAQQQKFKEADSLLQKALKIDPKNADLQVHRAMYILQLTGDTETAIKFIDEALALDEKCEFAYEILGTIEVQRGNLNKAIEMFDKAMPLIRTELEMAHICSLKNTAIAQKVVAEKLKISLPGSFSNYE